MNEDNGHLPEDELTTAWLRSDTYAVIAKRYRANGYPLLASGTLEDVAATLTGLPDSNTTGVVIVRLDEVVRTGKTGFDERKLFVAYEGDPEERSH